METNDLAKFGIDLGALNLVEKGGVGGRAWPPLWKAAVEALFVNGFSPDAINAALKTNIDRSSIYDWANAGQWWQRREEFQHRVTQKALALTEESAVDVTTRQIKGLRAFQSTLLRGITATGNPPSIKTLEGATAAYVTAVKAERQIRGLGGAADVTVETKNGNNGGDVFDIDLDALDKLPEAARERALEIYRRKMELEEELHALTTGDATVIEGEYREDQSAHPVEADGDEPSPEMP